MKLRRISVCVLLAACTAITSFATCNSTWQAVPSPSPAHQSGDANQLSGVAASSATDAWAVGWSLSFSGGGYQTLAEHWDGNQWNVVPTANTSMRNNYLRAVSVVEADDVWAIGQQDNGSGLPFTLVEHWDGHSWTVDSTATMQGSLGAVIAFSPNDVWAGGFVLEHFDGTSWKVQSVGAANYLGSFAGTTNNFWAVGYRTIQPIGPVLTFTAHRNAGAWARFRAVDPLNVSKDDEDVLVGVDIAPGDRHPFAVGYYADFDGGPPAQTLIEQWDGTKWVQMNSPNPGGTTMDNELWDVAALSPNDAWAVGTVGSDGSSDNQTMILHWDGSQWTATPNTGTGVLINVAGDKASSTLWAVGYAAASNYQGTLILSACGL